MHVLITKNANLTTIPFVGAEARAKARPSRKARQALKLNLMPRRAKAPEKGMARRAKSRAKARLRKARVKAKARREKEKASLVRDLVRILVRTKEHLPTLLFNDLRIHSFRTLEILTGGHPQAASKVSKFVITISQASARSQKAHVILYTLQFASGILHPKVVRLPVSVHTCISRKDLLEMRSRKLVLRPVSYTHLTLPTT